MNKSLLFAFILLCTVKPAFAKVIYVADNGFAVENSVTISKSPEQVWQALIYNIDDWWPKDHSWWGADGRFSIDPVAGGCFCEVAGKRSAEHMRISFVEPSKLLRMTGGLGPLQGMGMFGALDWKFETEGSGTTITLTYKANGYLEGGFDSLAPIVEKVQGMQLQGLADFLSN